MALPSSANWGILDFNSSNFSQILVSSPSDVALSPTSGAFSVTDGVLTVVSGNGVEAVADFGGVALPAKFTIDAVVRLPKQPHDAADLTTNRISIEIADGASRGIALHFSSSGLAISSVGDFTSATVLPDTSDDAQESATEPTTVRVAIDGGLGRAYVFITRGTVESPALRFILPADPSTSIASDRFRISVRGTSAQPAQLELYRLRIATGIVMPSALPIADGGPDRTVALGGAVRFDGRGSIDPEGAPLSYSWLLVEVPYSSRQATHLSSGETVDDGDSDGFTTVLHFDTLDPEVLVTSGDVVVLLGQAYVIATVASDHLTIAEDALPEPLAGVPFQLISQSALHGANTDTPYLFPDVTGTWRVRLVVNDGELDSEPVEVLASVNSGQAPFGVEPAVEVLWKALGDEWNYIPGREVFEEAWRGVAQIMAGKMLEAWQYHYNFSIRDAQSVLQRKWLPFRTWIPETSPNDATLKPRYGSLHASYTFEDGMPLLDGTTLVVESFDTSGTDPGATITHTVTFSSAAEASFNAFLAELNLQLAPVHAEAFGYGVVNGGPDLCFITEATPYGTSGATTLTLQLTEDVPSWVDSTCVISYGGQFYIGVASINHGLLRVDTTVPVPRDGKKKPVAFYRPVRAAIRANVGFRILNTSTATILGFPLMTWNHPVGTGARVTDRTYATFGTDLSLAGVSPGDLLVLNNGQSFTVDRVLSDPLDPHPGGRLLVREDLPLDASSDWALPSTVESTTTDYDARGVYPGDLVKVENFDTYHASIQPWTTRAKVVATLGTKAGVLINELFSQLAAMQASSRFAMTVLGVKRRKAVEVFEGTIGVPRLQDLIPLSESPTLWIENLDYVLEPFYRGDGAPVQMLQFRDETFIDPDTEPPDILWAELVLFDNNEQIEALFGTLVGFLRDDASKFDRDFDYLSGTAGLLYARQRGPHRYPIRIGAQILLGQPFAEVDGIIDAIEPEFSARRGRMLVKDTDPLRAGTLRAYLYKKDPLDTSSTSGLENNPSTGAPWAVGDAIPQFAPIGSGVGLSDMYNDPTWYYSYVGSGVMNELQKFHTFAVTYNVDLVSLANLALLKAFLVKSPPRDDAGFLLGEKFSVDEVDVTDDDRFVLNYNAVDSTSPTGHAFRYDDYRGDGTVWSYHDDGIIYYDAITDCPTDLLTLYLTTTWGGGTISGGSVFFIGTDVVDVDGAHTGTPGTVFTPTVSMTLEAGDYEVRVFLKTAGVVFP